MTDVSYGHYEPHPFVPLANEPTVCQHCPQVEQHYVHRDERFDASFYEVHAWPSQGRILVVNKVHYEPIPMLTWLDVTPGDPTRIAVRDTTETVAWALADAGNPAGDVVMHYRWDVTTYKASGAHGRVAR